MPVLILASEDTQLEDEIARKTAKSLGYTTLDPSFLSQVADRYGFDLRKLEEAMTITPSILKRMPEKKWRYYLACVEVAVLEALMEDNCVCWGLGAHLYVMVISHVLKVRLIGGVISPALSGTERNRIKRKVAEQEYIRERWAMAAFERKQTDPALYDMVINLDQIQGEEAVNTLTTTLGFARFKPMTYSKNTLADQVLAARVKQTLLKSLTDIQVRVQNGTVVVTTSSVKREKKKKIEAVKKLAGEVEGIRYLEVHWNKDILTEAATSFR